LVCTFHNYAFQTVRQRWFLRFAAREGKHPKSNSSAGGLSRRGHQQYAVLHCKILTGSSYARANADFSAGALEQLNS